MNRFPILSVQYGKKMLNGDPKALSSLKEEACNPAQNKNEPSLLLPDFPKISGTDLTIVPTAWTPDISETKNVTVFKRSVIELLYEQSNIKEFPTEASFDYFDLDFYPASQYDKTTGKKRPRYDGRDIKYMPSLYK